MKINQSLNQALEYSTSNKFSEAIQIYKDLLNKTSEPHKMYFNIALNYLRLQDKEQSLKAIKEALKIKPNYVEANILMFEVLAYFGDYREAFKYQEWSFGDDVLKHPSLEFSKKKRLDYHDVFVKQALHNRQNIPFEVTDTVSKESILAKVKDKVIYVMPSQGLGDIIQCSYYINKLLEYLPKKIIVAVRPELTRLLYELNDNIEVINYHPLEKDYDYFLPIFSLMKLLNGTDEPKDAWLHISKKDLKFFGNIINTKYQTGSKIGIVWRGNPKHSNDFYRSLSLNQMLQQLGSSDKTLYSLQFDVTEEEKQILKENNIIDLSTYIRDLYDIGAFIKNLDLFVSIDSAPIHVAGALGVKSLCLIPKYREDWRWGFEGDYKHYKSVKLIRFEKSC